jgi:hypothetical protein
MQEYQRKNLSVKSISVLVLANEELKVVAPRNVGPNSVLGIASHVVQLQVHWQVRKCQIKKNLLKKTCYISFISI